MTDLNGRFFAYPPTAGVTIFIDNDCGPTIRSMPDLEEGDEVAEMYRVRGTPTTVFIDRDGRIVGMTHTSDPDDPLLQSLTDQIL